MQRIPSAVAAKPGEARAYQICRHCVMDTSDPDITFDDEGHCHHCRDYMRGAARLPRDAPDSAAQLDTLVATINQAGRRRRYDCVIGVSGGVDSTYVAYLVKRELGLNPIAVHLDNGWNSELAVANIERIIERLEIDLETIVLDWNEFRSLQLAFLRASTPDSEIPTDHAITAALKKVANRIGVKYILIGSNFTTEHILVPAWSQGHADWRYIHSLNRAFGERRLQDFPRRSALGEFADRVLFRLQLVPILDYVPFDKSKAQSVIERELGWQPYGGKHYESLYTRFYQGYILPTKFGFDKRRSHLSCLVLAGQMTREAALQQLQAPALYPEEVKELTELVAKKLGLSAAGLEEIMALPPKRFEDFPSYQNSRAYELARKTYRALFERR